MNILPLRSHSSTNLISSLLSNQVPRNFLGTFSLCTRVSSSKEIVLSSGFKPKTYSSQADTEVRAKLRELIQEHFANHPFTTLVNEENSHEVMECYFAMSQAFPFIQAGAYQNIILNAIQRNQPISSEIEKTFVVGSFLCWDETGGHYKILSEGMKALPEILNTQGQFHSNLLRKDLTKIFKREMEPNYSPSTKAYLLELGKRLGDQDHVKRSAMMVAFESHANEMITALWDSLSKVHSLKKDSLEYFATHVGGDDPAEAYHVEMTSRLITKVVPKERLKEFYWYFSEGYRLNYDWCAAICNESNQKPFVRTNSELETSKQNGLWTDI